MTVKELLEKRANVWNQAQALREKVAKENRAFSVEEQTQWDAMVREMDDLKATADRLTDAERRESEMRASTTAPVRPAVGGENRGQAEDQEYRDALDTFLRKGTADLDSRQRTMLAERRALSAVTGNLGGYAIGQTSFGRFQEELKSFGGILQSRTELITTTSGEVMPIPVVDDTANKGRRIAEGQSANTNVDPAFNQRNLATYLYTSEIVKAPFQLLQDGEFDIEAWLWRKLAERIARITNEERTTGTGTDMPLGIVTGSGEGKVGASATEVAYQDLVDLFLAVDAAHRQNGEWMFGDGVLKKLMLLTDLDEKPLWVPSLVAGVPDMILNRKYVINNDMATPAAGAKTMLFGDLSAYKARDVRGAIVKRLEEKYIEEGMVGFVMFSRHGGTLASIGKAVKHFKHAAA